MGTFLIGPFFWASGDVSHWPIFFDQWGRFSLAQFWVGQWGRFSLALFLNNTY